MKVCACFAREAASICIVWFAGSAYTADSIMLLLWDKGQD
jgi:hypothetical protein